MGLIDALFDKEKAVLGALKEASVKFAKEIGCKEHDIQIRICYALDGNPYGELYKITEDEKGKRWTKYRDVKINEII